ncbi:2-phospho-L-lactate transferase CofD family protein, partial [Staphylococcus aureus]
KKIDRVFLEPNDVQPMEEAIDALREADLIVLGPGSLYTSVISNLCVNGISDALIHSDAPKLYVSNVMTQPGETDGYSVKDHIDAIHRQAGQPFIDYVICSTQTFNAQVLKKYEEKHSKPVEVNKAELEKESINVKTSSNLVEISENHLVRHNTKVLSTMIYDIALELISTIPFVPSDKRK